MLVRAEKRSKPKNKKVQEHNWQEQQGLWGVAEQRDKQHTSTWQSAPQEQSRRAEQSISRRMTKESSQALDMKAAATRRAGAIARHLVIKDETTGKTATIKVSEGNTFKASDLKPLGIRTYDPG